MATEEALAQVLRAAVLGDEAAITVLAQYLGGSTQTSTQDQVNAAIRARDAEWAGKEGFRAKRDPLAKEFPVLDPNRDPEGYEAATKLDARLFEKNPALPEEERLRKVAERV